MVLENIIAKIDRDSQAKISQIILDAKQKCDRIFSEARQQASKVAKDISQKGEQDAIESARCLMVLAQLDARNSILQRQQTIITGVYEDVLNQLKNLPDTEYNKLVKKLLLEHAQGDEEVVISESDKEKISPSLIEDVNKELLKKKRKGDLKLAKEFRAIPSGFVLRKGKIEINNSFEIIVKSLREETEQEVVNILFPKKG